MSAKRIRCFIAIPLPETVRAYLGREQQSVCHKQPIVATFPKPENLHLTVLFLGSCKPETLDRIKSVMDRTVAGQNPLRLRLGRLGTFPPNSKNPRVLWIGVNGDIDELEGLYRKLTYGLIDLNITDNSNPFTPHITLARVKKGRLCQIQECGLKLPFSIDEIPAFTVKEILLYRSDLSAGGPRYAVMHVSRFR